MYGCNLYLLTVMNCELGKPGASMYVRATHLDEPADCLSAKHIMAIVSYLINDRTQVYARCARVH
jgi:hypothetical protein